MVSKIFYWRADSAFMFFKYYIGNADNHKIMQKCLKLIAENG